MPIVGPHEQTKHSVHPVLDIARGRLSRRDRGRVPWPHRGVIATGARGVLDLTIRDEAREGAEHLRWCRGAHVRLRAEVGHAEVDQSSLASAA